MPGTLEELSSSLTSGVASELQKPCPQYYNPICITIENATCDHFCKIGYCENKAECLRLAEDNKPSCK